MTTASETGIYPFNEAWVPGSRMGLAVSERPDGGSFYEVLENMLLAATCEGLGTVFHIPVSDEAEQIKQIVHAPEGYEFLCLLNDRLPCRKRFPAQAESHQYGRADTFECVVISFLSGI